MGILDDGKLIYSDTDIGGTKSLSINMKKTLASNGIFTRTDANWYNKCNRYGWINPFDQDRVVKEFLFFTKPDCYIFSGSTINSGLTSGVKNNSIMAEAAARMPKVLGQLQLSVADPDGKRDNPFMFLLTNSVASKLDLPTINSESQESTKNIIGTGIQYRSHSLKSDNGYDFSLSFKDTAYLEVYTLAKCYDEYMRMVRLGEVEYNTIYREKYILNRIVPEQFSIYKFLIGSDGETILYYAKLTGCYFTDVPRSEFGDPGDEFKYSLSFHAQFVEDMNPQILKEFSLISHHSGKHMPVYDNEIAGINNLWARYPVIIKASNDATNSIYNKRVTRRGVKYDYFLKWVQ